MLRKLFDIDTYYAILREERSGKWNLPHLIWRFSASIIVSFRRFYENAGTVSASGLTMYTLVSIVPIIALFLAVAKGFGMKELIEEEIRNGFFSNPEVGEWLISFAGNALENAKGEVIAGVGIVILLWSVVKVMGTLEFVMNRIWGVDRGRSIARRFIDYLSVFFIVPVFMILICGSNVFVQANLEFLGQSGGIVQIAGSAIGRILKLGPYILVWFLFTFIYMFVPTTRVKFKYAVVAGVIAGTLFQIVQWVYIRFQIGVGSYNAMYGSLAALPLLLVWLQMSWQIVIWGTELCCVLRDGQFIGSKTAGRAFVWTEKISLSLRILRFVARKFGSGEGAVPFDDMVAEFRMGSGKLRYILQLLNDKGFLEEVSRGDDIAYIPKTDFHNVSAATVILRLSDMEDNPEEGWKRRYAESIRGTFGKETFL